VTDDKPELDGHEKDELEVLDLKAKGPFLWAIAKELLRAKGGVYLFYALLFLIVIITGIVLTITAWRATTIPATVPTSFFLG